MIENYYNEEIVIYSLENYSNIGLIIKITSKQFLKIKIIHFGYKNGLFLFLFLRSIISQLKEQNDYPLILTAVHISEILNVSKPTAYEVMKLKSFPLLEFGRCKRVLRDEFFTWLKNPNN
ncbi:hypothetical protein [Gottfriedia sp. OAE603]|uniref:hypothetical protein n=1 Tax=Gottfriedia sp. OAE603 TaxID=2663872 RepID=UPI0019EC4FC3